MGYIAKKAVATVCLLKKALYGSPISGKRWHDEIMKKIRALGYKQSVIYHFLFTREVGVCHSVPLVHSVDVQYFQSQQCSLLKLELLLFEIAPSMEVIISFLRV